MITMWNNRQGNRDRKAYAVLITEDGNVHQFTGASIPGVCESIETNYEKAGKWSNWTFEVLHRDSTSFVAWMADWDLGVPFPQPSWEAGFLWLATQAPGLSVDGFRSFIHRQFPQTAEKWDRRREAELAFAESRPLQHSGETARLCSEIKAKLQSQKEMAEKQERVLNDLSYEARCVQSSVDRSEEICQRAENIIEDAQRVIDECNEAAATHAAFGAGAFDSLANLKL